MDHINLSMMQRREIEKNKIITTTIISKIVRRKENEERSMYIP